MKQRLLSFFAVAALAMGAMAQTWTAPVEPTKPNADPVDYEIDGSYYIMNVGAGQFVTGANSWATTVSLGSDGMPFMKFLIEDAEDGFEDVRIKVDGEYTTYGSNYESGRAVGNDYVFRDNETNAFIDCNGRGKNIWTFIKNDNGTYYWRSAEGQSDIDYDVTEQYAASQGAGAAVKFNASIDTPDNEWVFISGDIDIEAYKNYSSDLAVYNAKLKLYNLQLDAVKYGADLAAATAVYNNASATVEELNAAYDALLKAMPAAVVAYAASHGTADAPVDMPYVFYNADFSLGNINGWTIAKPEGATGNYQYQGAKYTSEDESATIHGFIESWVPAPNHLGDVKIYQKIGGLPNGHYILECDAMAVNQTNPDNDPDNAVEKEDYTGVYLYYSDGTITMHSEPLASDFKEVYNEETGESSYASFPAHFIYEFDLSTTADTIMVGLMSENTNLNWMGADNFVLKFAGATQTLPSYTALVAEIGTSEAYLETEPVAEKAAIEALSTALAEAKALTAGGADEAKDAQYQAAFTKLSEARAAVATSVEAYKKLDSFIEKLNEEIDKYDAIPNYGKLVKKLEALVGEMEDAQTNNNLSAAEIEAAINGYDAMVKDTIKEIFADLVASNEPLEEPFEITDLFSDMSYPDTNGGDQESFPNGYPAANPAWMNETSTGNFKTNYGTAEVWDARPFNIYRDFTDLPKGSYTIQTMAFYRVTENSGNYNSYTAGDYDGSEFAYLYFGNNKTHLINVAEIASDFVEYPSPVNVGTDDEPLYVPNNQQSASQIFSLEQYADLAEKCVVQATDLITSETGTLRAGIAGTSNLQGNHWTIWYSWRLFYNGEDASAYDKVIEDLIAQAQELTPVLADANDKIAAAVQAGQTAMDNDDKAAKVVAITALKEAIQYANDGDALYAQMKNEVIARQERIDALESNESDIVYSNTSYRELLAEAEAIDPDGDVKPQSIEQLQTYIDRMNNEWNEFTASWEKEGLEAATIDDPVDVSGLIENNSFDNEWSGWTYKTSRGNPGIEGNSGNCAEFWNTGTFDINQTLPTLKEGYWRLEVDALYRPGNPDNVITVLNQQAEGKDTVMLSNEYIYVQANGFNVSRKVMPWSDTTGGAIIYTLDEDGETLLFDEADQDAADIIGDSKVNYSATAFKFIAPNNRTQMKAFVDGGRYHNVIDFAYVPSNGNVKIGINLLDDITAGACWCPFDDFRLYYLGTEMPDAVKGIATNGTATAAGQIFSIDGRQKSNLTRGINIVRTNDGAVRKVLVK